MIVSPVTLEQGCPTRGPFYYCQVELLFLKVGKLYEGGQFCQDVGKISGDRLLTGIAGKIRGSQKNLRKMR